MTHTDVPESDNNPQSSRLSTIIRNALSILGSDLANRASSFALYALVARFLGERAFGQMSLAQSTFFFLGYSLAALGVRWFLARELAKRPEKTETYLVHGTAMVVTTTTLALILFFIVGLISGYPADTRAAIMLMGLTMFPYTMMMVLEGTFIGREKMHFVFLVNAPLNVLNIIVTFLVLQNGGDLFNVITVQVIAYSFIAIIEWVLMLRFVVRPRFHVTLSGMRELIRATSSFFGIDAVVAVLATIQLYLISLVADETRVGLFSSATQVYGPLLLIISSIVSSMLPVLTRQVDVGLRRVKISAERLIELLLWISVPAAAGLIVVAPELLVFIYGRESFGEAGIYLRIIAVSLVIHALISVLGNLLYATSHERENLRIVSINSILSLVFNVIVISLYGALGAAIISVGLQLIDLALHYSAVSRNLKLRLNILPLFWRTLLASAVMVIVLNFVPVDLHVLIRIAIGGAVYGVSMAVILFLTVGGPGEIRAKYLSRPDDVIAAQAAGLTPTGDGD